MRIDKNTKIYLGQTEIVKIKKGNVVIWEKSSGPVVEPDYVYIENTYNGSNTISVKQTLSGSPDSSAYAKHLQYSKDGLNWTTITLSSTTYTISLAKGEKVYFRNNERVFNYWTSAGANQAITNISASQSHTVGGNINSLIDYTDPYGLTLPQGAFNGLFENDTHLTSASDITLPTSSDGTVSTYCYLYMFKGCSALTSVPQSLPVAIMTNSTDAYDGMFAYTAITTAPALPSTQLGNNCYLSMFEGCTALVNAPALPAMTLTSNCYNKMFYGCSSLVNAPALPATTLANQCYQQMFRNCTSLTSAPSTLPATTAPYMCYHRMFSDCTALTSVPTLPATIVESGCYQYMFFGCTALTKAPTELPATTLTLNCYYEMFGNCSNLTSAPVIKAKTFAKQSCSVMFRNCKHLNNLTVYADDNSAEKCTDRWLYGVASSGILNNFGSATYATSSASGIPMGWVENTDSKDYLYIENTSNSANNIYLKTRAGYAGTEPTGEFATTLQYSKNRRTWKTINLDYSYTKSGSSVVITTVTNLTLSLAKNEKVYFRNTSGYFGYVNDIEMTTNNYGEHRHMFSSDGSIKVGGNPKSLLNYRDMNGTTLKKGCFNGLFYGAEKLTDASGLNLNDTVLAESCYMMMFENCYRLTSAPVLPATTMAPRCYYEMFKNTGITSAPVLPATTLATYCYKNMFESCTSITSAPNLPATTLATGCYQGMFNTCTYLTTAPVLRATTLAEYCYRYMFMGCVRLNSVTTFANDNSANESTRWWLNNVAATGIVHNLGSATYTHNSTDGIPSGWTELNS